MKLTLIEVILWPKAPKLQPRTISFAPGKVNVITGASRTGKSAIIPIIDYCLGSDSCSIPVGIIRDTTEWFGILINTVEGRKLFARRGPGNQSSTGDMYLLQGEKIDIPDRIPGKNATVDMVKSVMDEMASLSSLDIDPDAGKNAFKGRPSFRDMMAFVFQPQNVVANPDVLFYKADSFEHREKLKNIFPYVLGALSPEALLIRHQILTLEREINRKRREFEQLGTVSGKWIAELVGKIMQAREIGLIPSETVINEDKESLLKLVRTIVEKSGGEIRATAQTISKSVSEIATLAEQENTIATELLNLKRKMSEITRLKDTSRQYQQALVVQRDRLKISEWLDKRFQNNHECPFCGEESTSGAKTLNVLVRSLQSIEEEMPQITAAPHILDRELITLRRESEHAAEALEAVQIRRQHLQEINEDARNQHYSALSASRFIGGLEESLRFYEKLGMGNDLSTELQTMAAELATLKKQINEAQIQKKVENSLKIIEQNIARLLPGLDVENPDRAVEFSLADLSVKIVSQGRKDYLWEVGSGSNWLGYHVATIVAFHKYFLSMKPPSAVPSLLLLDQPSQVYFPRVLNARSRFKESSDPEFKDADVVAVRKIFETLAKAVSASAEQLQVVVLDHAAENVWGGISEVHKVEEWRNAKALVPNSWIQQSAP